MQTSTSMTKRITNPYTLTRSGFTLLEILIALALMSLVFSFALSYNWTPRQTLEGEANKIERAVRYCTDEAPLRNKVIRLKFTLEKKPQTLALQVGPDDNFVLPTKTTLERDKLSESEIKNVEEELNKYEKNFIPISDISESNLTLEDDVQILGLGLLQEKKIIYDFFPSVYFYPNGERDGVLVFLATDEEIIGIIVSPFSSKIERIYQKIELLENEDLEEVRFTTMTNMFEEYLK